MSGPTGSAEAPKVQLQKPSKDSGQFQGHGFLGFEMLFFLNCGFSFKI